MTTKKPKADPLVTKMNAYADALLTSAKGAKVKIPERVDVFKEVARWIAVKNRLDPDGNDREGAGLDDIRNNLAARQNGQRKGVFGRGRNASAAGRARQLSAEQLEAVAGNGGTELDVLKGRLPKSGDGSANGARSSPVSSPYSIARRSGGVPPGVDRNPKP